MVGISAAVADVRTSTVDIPSSVSASDTLAALLPVGRGSVLVIFLLPRGAEQRPEASRQCGTVGSREQSARRPPTLLDAPAPVASTTAEATSSWMSNSASAPVTCNGRVTAREAATRRSRLPRSARRRAPPMSTASPLDARNVTPLRSTTTPEPSACEASTASSRPACRRAAVSVSISPSTASRTVPGRGRDTCVSSGRPVPKGSGAAASDTAVHLRRARGSTDVDPTAERAGPHSRRAAPYRRGATDSGRGDHLVTLLAVLRRSRDHARRHGGRHTRLKRCWVALGSEHPLPTHRGCRRCCTTPRPPCSSSTSTGSRWSTPTPRRSR